MGRPAPEPDGQDRPSEREIEQRRQLRTGKLVERATNDPGDLVCRPAVEEDEEE